MLQHLLDLVGRLGHWSYLIIFLAAALECSAFVGLLVPGESLVLAAGFLAHQGTLSLEAVMAAAAVGAIAGDNVGYQLGLRLGRGWLLHHGRRFGITQARLERAEQFFGRQGSKAVFRLVHGFARPCRPWPAPRNAAHRFVLRRGRSHPLTVGCTPRVRPGASWRLAERWPGAWGPSWPWTVIVAVPRGGEPARAAGRIPRNA